jgi:hypothetical protein
LSVALDIPVLAMSSLLEMALLSNCTVKSFPLGILYKDSPSDDLDSTRLRSKCQEKS